jgi:hypothetical protein
VARRRARQLGVVKGGEAEARDGVGQRGVGVARRAFVFFGLFV